MERPNAYQLSRKLGKALSTQDLKIAVAESCTGGGLAYAITSVAGSSLWFDRGVVTYSNEAKMELLGVSEQTILTYGEVSVETAKEMAAGILNISSADMSLSITGIAGPAGGSDKKPVGTVCFGLAWRGDVIKTEKKQFYSGRKHVRDCSVGFVLEWALSEVAARF